MTQKGGTLQISCQGEKLAMKQRAAIKQENHCSQAINYTLQLSTLLNNLAAFHREGQFVTHLSLSPLIILSSHLYVGHTLQLTVYLAFTYCLHCCCQAAETKSIKCAFSAVWLCALDSYVP